MEQIEFSLIDDKILYPFVYTVMGTEGWRVLLESICAVLTI